MGMERMYNGFEFFNCFFPGSRGLWVRRPFCKSYCDRIFWQRQLFFIVSQAHMGWDEDLQGWNACRLNTLSGNFYISKKFLKNMRFFSFVKQFEKHSSKYEYEYEQFPSYPSPSDKILCETENCLGVCEEHTHSVGVGLSSESAYLPAGCEIIMKINKLYFEKHYFKIEVGHWVLAELFAFPTFPSPFPICQCLGLPSQMLSNCSSPRSTYARKAHDRA